jgi:uncharacterized protein
VRRGIQLKIEQLLDGEKTIRTEVPPAAEFSIEGNAQLEVTLNRRGTHVFVQGKVTFVQRLECSRCSKMISSRRTEDVRAIYLPYAPTNDDLELSESDIEVLYYKNDVVDLEQPVRDAIVLSVPMRPLCHPDCRGLCPSCGANLNDGGCTCAAEPVDPRWKTLEKLLP